MVLVGAFISLFAGLVAVVPVAAAAQTADLDPNCVASVFDDAMQQRTAFVARGRPVTAAVHDTATGCWYHLDEGLVLTTASAIKPTVLAANLARARAQGRSLSPTEANWASRMISLSHNGSATTPLYGQVGVDGMAAYTAAVGAGHTRHTTDYGSTASTARDLALVSESMLHLGSRLGPLDDASRAVAWGYMTSVHPSQQFGITAGVPEGYDVALKNGFFPCRVACVEPARLWGVYRWRVGSTGFVRRIGQADGLAIAVLTDGNQTQSEGVALVEFIARHVSAELLGGDVANRDFDRATCATVQSSDAAAAITAALGVDVGRWASVRWTSGNEGPYWGQTMCADSLRPPSGEFDHLGRTEVNGDFDGDGHTDLAIGLPGSSTLLASDVGVVNVVGRAAIRYDGHRSALTLRQDHAESGDRFGAALAVGDFNGDGFDDLAVGAPGETVGNAADAGAVTILHGGPSGLQRVAFLHQESVLDRAAEAGDHFGWALASADVDDDGYDDLVIGAPGKNRSRGAVVRMLGSSSGLTTLRATMADADDRGVATTAAAGQRFGSSLAVGNLDGARRPEIIIGVPFADFAGADRAGLVIACRDGSLATCERWIHQGRRWVPGKNETGDRFGLTLETRDTDADGIDELLIGVPYEVRPGHVDAGRLVVVDHLYVNPSAANVR